MATTLSVQVTSSIDGEFKKPDTAGSIASFNFRKTPPLLLRNGIGSGRADIAWQSQRNLASNTSESLDLVGALATAFGDTISAAKVKALEIEALDTNTTSLTIGNVTNGAQLFLGGAAHTIVLAPGERFVIASPTGWTLTAGTADLLKVANGSGAAADYRIKVVAASA